MVSFFRKSKYMVTKNQEIPIHEALQPPLLQSQRSFEGQGEGRVGVFDSSL